MISSVRNGFISAEFDKMGREELIKLFKTSGTGIFYSYLKESNEEEKMEVVEGSEEFT